MAKHIPRLYCKTIQQYFKLSEFQSIHLVRVLRMKTGDIFIAFNSNDGEWLCSISEINKKSVIAKSSKLLQKYIYSKTINLAFCLVKPDNNKLIIEKCTELGVTDFYPIISDYTQVRSINTEKLNTIAIQASEQSERLDIPTIHEIMTFDQFLQSINRNTIWMSAIERSNNTKSIFDLNLKNHNIGFVVGPEGGFSDTEKNILYNKTIAINISKNILRSETACITCIAISKAY